MKLSDLIHFLNHLDQVDLKQCYTDSLEPVDRINTMISGSNVLAVNLKQSVADSAISVKNNIETFVKSVEILRKKVLEQIAQEEKQYFINSTTLYNTGYRNDTPKHIASRTTALSPAAADAFSQRLKIHTNWQHAGLIIRPVHLDILHDIVALDPFYLVDTHEELLKPIIKQFNDRYRRRVRAYLLNEYSDGPMLYRMPSNQFGLVAAQNFLNFKPLEIINQLVSEVYDILQPGGAFVFTYNNCDYAGQVRLVEHFSGCYTPGRLIRDHAIKTGYTINFEFNETNGVNILELLKPGRRDSIRGGQTLAVVKDGVETANVSDIVKIKKEIPPKIVDSRIVKYYTKSEKLKIRLSALILEIDNEENLFKTVDIEKLEDLVNDRLNTPDFNIEKFHKRLDKLIQQRKNP